MPFATKLSQRMQSIQRLPFAANSPYKKTPPTLLKSTTTSTGRPEMEVRRLNSKRLRRGVLGKRRTCDATNLACALVIRDAKQTRHDPAPLVFVALPLYIPLAMNNSCIVRFSVDSSLKLQHYLYTL